MNYTNPITNHYSKDNRVFFYGKYRGQYIKDVIRFDTQYITWCLKNVGWLRLNENEMGLYNTTLHNLIVERSKLKRYRENKERRLRNENTEGIAK